MPPKTVAGVEFDNLKFDVDRHSILLEGNGKAKGLTTIVEVLYNDVKAIKKGQAAIVVTVIADIVLRVFKVTV